jgi:transcriptional regulator NrdR family protein
MKCPQCRSEYLVIRQRTGAEWIILQFTKKRKYHCVQCGHKFRAPDRRKSVRPEGKIYTVGPEHLRADAVRAENENSSSKVQVKSGQG